VTRTMTTRSGRTVEVHKLTGDLADALRQFNDELSDESRSLFRPHRYDAATIARYVERCETGEDLIYCLLADGKIVGYFFLWFFREAVPLLGIGVLDEYQGQGLGRQMMSLLIDEAKAAGRRGIELTTMPHNDRAFELYKKMGFRYMRDVENRDGDGNVMIERAMFLRLVEGAEPTDRKFNPPI